MQGLIRRFCRFEKVVQRRLPKGRSLQLLGDHADADTHGDRGLGGFEQAQQIVNICLRLNFSRALISTQFAHFWMDTS
jgi:hypothetical protein